MKLVRQTRMLFLCLSDVLRARGDLAAAWRDVRRETWRPAGVLAVKLRRALRALARAEEILCLAVDCCVQPATAEEVRA